MRPNLESNARAFFWASLGCSALTAVIFTGYWLGYDREASTADILLSQGRLDPYDYDHGGMDDRGVAHGSVPESRALSEDYIFLLKVVPASILGLWFVASWIAFGRDAFRLRTIMSFFRARPAPPPPGE